MSPAYQRFKDSLASLLDQGVTLHDAVQQVNQQYGELADKAAQELLEKQALEKALRNCQRHLKKRS